MYTLYVHFKCKQTDFYIYATDKRAYFLIIGDACKQLYTYALIYRCVHLQLTGYQLFIQSFIRISSCCSQYFAIRSTITALLFSTLATKSSSVQLIYLRIFSAPGA